MMRYLVQTRDGIFVNGDVFLSFWEATGDLIGNKIADRIMKVSKTSQQNNSETVTNEHYNEIPKVGYIYIYIYIHPEERQKIIDNLDIKIIV